MRTQRLAAWASVLAVAAAVVTGLSIIGKPSEQRLIRLDERRVTDLRILAGAVNRYRGQRQELPARAEDAIDGQITTRLPLDPESQQPYDYRVIDAGHYEVCATFSRRSREPSNDFWFHESGRRCFSLDADQNPYKSGVRTRVP
jgi:hypothetical protein